MTLKFVIALLDLFYAHSYQRRMRSLLKIHFHKHFRKLNCPAVAQFSKQALELCHTGKETKTKRSCAPFTHQSVFPGHVEYNNI